MIKIHMSTYECDTIYDLLNTYVRESIRIGSQCRVGNGTSIESRVRIGDRCVIGESVSIAQNTTIGNDTTIQSGVKIGANVKIGSGCNILTDIPTHTVIPDNIELVTPPIALCFSGMWCNTIAEKNCDTLIRIGDKILLYSKWMESKSHQEVEDEICHTLMNLEGMTRHTP